MPALKSVLSRLAMGLTALFVICACGRQGGSPIEGGGRHDLVPSQTRPPAPAPFPGPRPARADGTIDGGGGPYKAERKVEDKDIKHALESAKLVMPYLFNYWESYWYGLNWGVQYGPDSHVVDKEILATFFPMDPAKKDVFQRFAEMTLKPTDQPCYDKFKNPMAASAWPYESNEICFSLPLIRANATIANLYNRILALVFHEMIHKMGTENEEKADRIEKWVIERFLPADTFDYTRERLSNLFEATFMDPHGFGMGGGVQKTIRRIEDKLNAAGEIDWGEICLDLGYVGLSTSFVAKDIPIGLLRASLTARQWAASEKSRMLTLYCRRDPQEALRFGLFYDGQASNQELLVHRVRRTERDGNPPVFRTITIRRPQYHAKEKLLAELKDIREAADEINQELYKLPAALQGYRQSVLSIVPQ